MIVSLKGRLLDAADSIVFLEVQGVGFEVNASASVLKSLPPLGQELQVFTYLQVREDNMALYGFSSWEGVACLKDYQRCWIGPKSGLAIISSIDQRALSTLYRPRSKDLTTLPELARRLGRGFS